MIEVSVQTRKLLELSMLKGVGPAALRKVVQVQRFEEMSVEELLPHLPRKTGAGISHTAIAEARSEAVRQVDLALGAGAYIISSADSYYPRLLLQTRDDPQILFVKGQLSSTPEKSIAIIGTREPTEHGKIITERLTSFFVKERWSIISGLALGCDAIAHKSAIYAGGHTVAVLAHGLQTIAPKRHQKLADQILETGGALISEYPFGQEPLPAQFVKRDRTQAGLAQGVVMIQSDVTGGSLFASRAALNYQRWLAVPYPTDQDISKQEPKIQANLLLAAASPAERIDLLKCELSDLKRLSILRSKSDYGQLVRALLSTDYSPAPPLTQGQLF